MTEINRSKGVKAYGIAIIVYGVFNLVGLGSFSQFSPMFNPLPHLVIVSVYAFTIFYGICGVYCGSKILKLENWARKFMISVTAINLIAAFLLNRTVMSNLRDFLYSGEVGIPASAAPVAYMSVVIFTVLFAIFELSIIYFLTRPSVAKQFQGQS